MHTAICAFDDQTRAEQARDSLLRAGFARDDVHIEHKHLGGEGETGTDRWDGMEREVAVDRGVLSSFGHFFASLLGRDNPSGHVDTYSQHVERGSYVVVVDTDDQVQAERARTMLHEMQPGDLNVVHRPEQRPLRDIVGMRQGTAGMVERNRQPSEGVNSSAAASGIERERAMATNVVSPTTGPELRAPESDRAPGLRYADKDKDKPF